MGLQEEEGGRGQRVCIFTVLDLLHKFCFWFEEVNIRMKTTKNFQTLDILRLKFFSSKYFVIQVF